MRKSRERERRLLRTWLDQVAELRRPTVTAEPFEVDPHAQEETRIRDAEESSIGGWAREASS